MRLFFVSYNLIEFNICTLIKLIKRIKEKYNNRIRNKFKMVRLGKAVKGKTKTKTTEQKRVMVKIRNQDKTMEDAEKEQLIMKMKRDHLK
jgi:hypothetical protein